MSRRRRTPRRIRPEASRAPKAFAKTDARWRPRVHAEILMLGAGIYFASVFNGEFFARAAQTGAFEAAGGWILAACLFLAIAAVHVLLLAFVPGRTLVKIVVSSLLIGAAAVIVASEGGADVDIVRFRETVAGTDVSPVWYSPAALAWVALLAGLPTAAVWWVQLVPRRWGVAAAARVCLVVLASVIFVFGVKLPGHAITRLRQQHPELVPLIAPLNLVVAGSNAVFGDTSPMGLAAVPVLFQPVASVPDATLIVGGLRSSLALARRPSAEFRRSHG